MIIVDDRERSVYARLCVDKASVQQLRMDAGDFLIACADADELPLLIERKTWGDLLHSWYAGRLQEQLQKMFATTVNEHEVRPILLVEGSLGWYMKYARTNVMSVAGILSSLCYAWKVPVIPSQSMGMTTLILKSLDKMHSDTTGKHDIHVRTAEISRTDCRLNMLACVTGVGGITATKILGKYKSIAHVVNASLEDLRRDLGHKTGEWVFEALHDETDFQV